ncbi:MAG: hypothetical protein RL885_33370 [Planctomycetota bacterium]
MKTLLIFLVLLAIPLQYFTLVFVAVAFAGMGHGGPWIDGEWTWADLGILLWISAPLLALVVPSLFLARILIKERRERRSRRQRRAHEHLARFHPQD